MERDRRIGGFDDAFEDKEDKENKLTKEQQDAEDWKQAVNAVASSEEGKIFLCAMTEYMLLSRSIGSQVPPSELIAINARREFYLNRVRPHLSSENIKEIEIDAVRRTR